MIDTKKNLYTYMTNFPRSFVGFFELISEILKDLGVEWQEHSKKNEDAKAAEWATAFIGASETIHGVSQLFEKLRSEYDAREEEKINTDPVALIQNFKAQVEKIKKNGSTNM